MRKDRSVLGVIRAKDKMIKVALLMVLCSEIAANDCKVIPTSQILFDDYSSCIIYGYDYSYKLMSSFDTEWINSVKAYTKFSCESSEST